MGRSLAVVLPRLALTLGAFMVLGALTLGVAQHQTARDRDIATDLQRDVALRATALEDYFARARTVNLMLANNPAFGDYYREEGSDHGAGHAPADDSIDRPGATASGAGAPERTLHRINQALAHLESLFPDSIGEACFIDVHGHENARVVRGSVATPGDLSPDETTAPFFGPTVALDAGAVHQAQPYVSPDTDEWVISNSTLIDVDGEHPAMVHFEVTLASFGPDVGERVDLRSRILEAGTGEVLLDSEHGWGKPPRSWQEDARITIPLPPPGGSDWRVVDGDLLALSRINTTSGADNANDWVVVLSTSEASGIGLQMEGPAAALLILGGLLLLVGLNALLRRNDRLTVQTHTDELTGLLNRRGFVGAMSRSPGSGPCHVAIIDLNRFKQVNDSFGHEAGDDLLRQVAGRLQDGLPWGCALARLGGDEFAVGLWNDHATMQSGMEAISEQLRTPFTLRQGPVLTGAAIGVASMPDHASTAVEAMRYADVAMYHAKRTGQDVAVYDPSQDLNSSRRVQLHQSLSTAIEHGLLDVHFQPQVGVATGRTVGFEALARWNDAEEGDVSPTEFIPLAEGTGLMPALTKLVVERCAEFLSDLGAESTLTVSVNVSPRALVDGWVVTTVGSALERWGVEPSRLVIELTEDLLVGDSDIEIAALEDLRDLGCAISIDDFGTGHSSLAYLSRLPADELKIDRAFVANVAEDASMGFILRSTVDLAQHLGLRTVAEGVETEEMMNLISALGCDLAQGWLFAPALPAAAARDWLHDEAERSADAELPAPPRAHELMSPGRGLEAGPR